jgi:hypothetical protein
MSTFTCRRQGAACQPRRRHGDSAVRVLADGSEGQQVESQARPPPGYSLKSFPAPKPSTSMRLQEIRAIRGGRLSCFTTVSVPSSVPGSCKRYSVPLCRVQRPGKSVWLVALTRIKVSHSGIHLVLKDAIGGPARCPADDEHAPTANIDPDGIRLIGGSSAHWSASRTAGPLLAPPTHRGHLRRSTRPALTSTAEPVTTTVAAAGSARRCFGRRSRAAQPSEALQTVVASGGTAHASGMDDVQLGQPWGSLVVAKDDWQLSSRTGPGNPGVVARTPQVPYSRDESENTF